MRGDRRPANPHRNRAVAAILAAIALVPLVAAVGRAQNPLIEALVPEGPPAAEAAADSAPSSDPLREIDDALAEARRRVASLERARGAGAVDTPSPALELATRLVSVLEQRREAQIQANALALGRSAIESGLARDPSEIVGIPPPFPVPTLDGVSQAWHREVEQEQQRQRVLEDRRANQRLSRERLTDLEKERRRLRDRLSGSDSEVEQIRLESELRTLDNRVAIAREQLALAEQRVANAETELEIQQISTRQARKALSWVKSQVAPRESDLSDALERLDRERIELDRELDLARSRLANAEGALQAAEERAPATVHEGDDAASSRELATRRRELGHRQQIVALLNQRIERLTRMRTSWQRRYAVLGDRVDLAEVPGWRDAADSELDRLTRLRRIHEAELAEAQLALATRLREAASAGGRRRAARFDDLERLIAVYEGDLSSLDRAIALEDRLRVELLARIRTRDLGERVRGLFDSFVSFWSFELTTSGDRPITPGKILIALAVFATGLLLARTLRRVLSTRFFPRVGFDAGASSAFAALAFYALLGVAFLLALRAVNIPLTAFAVAGGALAIGVGFGSQTIISNFISGLLLLAERPIRTGDLVEIGGVLGSVESIGLRSTRIRTPDNFHIIVPNASFLESNVVNWTHEDPVLRLRIKVGVAYGSPVRRVEALLVQAATEHPRSLPHPAPIAVFEDFGDSALVFELRFWIRYDLQTDRTRLQSDVRYRIEELFAEDAIVIAFPQMDVHLDMPERDAVDRPRAQREQADRSG